jgi:ATP-dependent DNA helicase DinG
MAETSGPRFLDAPLKAAIQSAYEHVKLGLPGFRPRASQRLMVAEVARGLASEQGVVAIEAPTGTGKSLAYLLAALPLATARKRKLVIATATVALQEQLLYRDLPTFLQATGLEVSVALAKGRQRYLCVRNLLELLEEPSSIPQGGLDFGEYTTEARWRQPPSAQQRERLQAVAAAFDAAQWNGDLDRCPEPLDEASRALLTTSAGGCSNRRCPQLSRCPFVLARNAVLAADLVVANHDLVLADLAIGSDSDGPGGVLLPQPSETFYVFDEAHQLADKAVEAGKAELGIAEARRRLSRLASPLRQVFQHCARERIGQMSADEVDTLLDAHLAGLDSMKSAIDVAWPARAEATVAPDETVWRSPLGRIPEAWRIQAAELALQATKLARWLPVALKRAVELELPPQRRENLARELGLAAERVAAYAELWQLWAQQDPANHAPIARWLHRAGDGSLILHASEVSAASVLRRRLWPHAAGVVLTSATLSTGGNFRPLRSELGLPDHALTLALASPFDLPRQARLVIPSMSALPDQAEAHVAAVVDWLDRSLDWQAGNLVLFTSRRKLEATLEALPAKRAQKVRAQGSAAKSELLSAHRMAIENGEGSTLFGLASFGEGLDLPGALCETVVITQLPFAVPTDPVGATRAEWLQASGRNPFLELAVPQTLRTLVQYCGRLIRSEQDRGRIVILDRRLLIRRYGRLMLEALPPFERRIETEQD